MPNAKTLPADEHKAVWVDKGSKGKVYQKGFDGDELKDYIHSVASKYGHKVEVKLTKKNPQE